MCIRDRLRIRYLILCLAVTVCVGFRAYTAIVPLGAKPLAYLLAKVNGGTITSPNGVAYEVWFNDAGAMHSGAHWTWIVSNNAILGKLVVTEGYLGPEHAHDNKTISLEWKDDIPKVDFLASRH